MFVFPGRYTYVKLILRPEKPDEEPTPTEFSIEVQVIDRDDERDRGYAEQDEVRPARERSRHGDETLAQRRGDKAPEGRTSAPLEPDEQRDDEQYAPERVPPLGRGELQIAHGSLRSTLFANSVEASISTRPAPAKAA